MGYIFKDRSLLQVFYIARGKFKLICVYNQLRVFCLKFYVLSRVSFDPKLALTHPSYHLNFGMNPDHARNSLSNCGVKQPRYGDRKIRHLHTRKKGRGREYPLITRDGQVQRPNLHDGLLYSFFSYFQIPPILGDSGTNPVSRYFFFHQRPISLRC